VLVKVAVKLFILGLVPFLFLQPTSVFGSEIENIQGMIINESQAHQHGGEFSVILHVFKPDKSLETFTANTDPSGSFLLQAIPLSADFRYVISTNHEDIEYAKEIPLKELMDNIRLSVFDTTESLKTLSIDSHLWLLKDVHPKTRHILITEIVMVNNNGNLVFAPNLSDPSKMNFLRFSLPAGYSELHMETDVGSGNILEVGTGFGMTSPIPPGPHQIIFTYTIPYHNDQIAITRKFLQELDVLQVLFPTNHGSISSPNLEELESTIIGDVTYHAWAARNVLGGSTIIVNLTNLKEPSISDILFAERTIKKYLIIGIPSALGLILLITLILVSVRPLSTALRNLNRQNDHQFNNLESNSALLYDVAYLDSTFGIEKMPEAQYSDVRSKLMILILLRIERQKLLASGLHDKE